MTDSNTIVLPPRTRLWPAYRALMGTGLACAVLIVAVFYATKPVIDANRQAQLEAAIFKVLPGTTGQRGFYLSKEGELFVPGAVPDIVKITGRKLYAGFDAAGKMTGIAITAQGIGYQDTIRVLYGYKPMTQTISGMQVLDSKETPGLGDKIEKDPAFVANFEQLDVALADSTKQLAKPIIAVKHGEKSAPWQIDGITGATISSEAIANILHHSTSGLLPDLYVQQEWIQSLYDGVHESTRAGEAQQSP